MKKFSVLLAVILVAVFIIAGCRGATTTPAQTTSAPPTTTAPTTTQAPTTTVPTTTVPITTTTVPTTTKPATTTTAAGQPQYGGTFVWTHNGGMTDINPAVDGGTVIYRNLAPALEPLLRFNEQGILQGLLAESWDISPDGKQITIHLRKGIKFHDGTDFNAQAVKYNLEKTFEAKVSGSADLAKVQSYDVIDDNTLRINLKEFDFRVLYTLAGGTSAVGLIASPTALQKPATPENRAQLHTVGTGPFIFDSWRRDDFVKYKKNPNYWQPGKPYLDGIEIRNVADKTVSVMAFQSGAVNLLENVDPSDATMLKSQGYDVTMAGLRFIHSFVTSGANPDSPFKDKRVREAVIYAIDKKTIVEGIGGGLKYGYVVTDTMSDPTNPYHPNVPGREYNPAKAKQLLAEAGYPQGFKTTLLVDVRLSPKDFAEALQTYWKEVGIETTFEVVDVPRFTEIASKGWNGILHRGFPTPGNMSRVVAAWGVETDNVSMYRPPGFQEKWNAIITEPDETKRNNLMREMLTLMYDEAIVVPYRANSPLKVSDGKIHDPKYMIHAGGWTDVWWPEVFWLEK